MTHTSISKGKSLKIFLSRLGFPAAVILVILIVQETVTLGEAIRSILAAGLVFFGVFLVIRLLDAALLVWYMRRRKPYPLPDVLRGLILAVLYVILVLIILHKLQVDIKPYLTGSAILTAVIGLAFQGVLSNVFSGISLHFTKAFSRGDWVEIGPYEGIVMDTNWRETRILDRYSNIIILPNNTVATERITNFSRPDPIAALTMTFKISYDAPAADVLKALLEAANDASDVLDAPAPEAYITSYDEFGVSYLCKFWITDFARKNPIMGDVGRLAWYKLRRAKIDIAVPLGEKVGDIVQAMKSSSSREGGSAPAADSEGNFQDLRRSSFLRHPQGDSSGRMIISDEDIKTMANQVRRSSYAKGEILFRQGEKGRSCFVVAKGKIRGQIAYEESGKKFLSEFTLEPGGIIGEMSLFTGMPRTATGIVAEESELLEIQADDFAVLLNRNPALAETIAEIVSARNEQNREFLKKIKELSDKDIQDGTNKKTILEYLRKFVHSLTR
ncbi:MAG: mechanosensitive ion channel family protein [Candidatus Aminicenantales bacterium]